MPRPEPPCRLKAGRFSLPVLHFDTLDESGLRTHLRQQVERARALLENAAILLAPAENLADAEPQAMQRIVEACRAEALFPVGLLHGPASEPWQRHTGLRMLYAGLSQLPEEPRSDQSSPTCENRLLPRQVRSGQQAMSPHGSLTVLASVSATAEVLARDDIHIHGVLKGKALAGIRGNEQACITCQRFEAELVAIAGHYRLFDEPDPELFGKPVCVRLEGEQLHFTVFASP